MVDLVQDLLTILTFSISTVCICNKNLNFCKIREKTHLDVIISLQLTPGL